MTTVLPKTLQTAFRRLDAGLECSQPCFAANTICCIGSIACSGAGSSDCCSMEQPINKTITNAERCFMSRRTVDITEDGRLTFHFRNRASRPSVHVMVLRLFPHIVDCSNQAWFAGHSWHRSPYVVGSICAPHDEH